MFCLENNFEIKRDLKRPVSFCDSSVLTERIEYIRSFYHG